MKICPLLRVKKRMGAEKNLLFMRFRKWSPFVGDYYNMYIMHFKYLEKLAHS